MNSDTWIQVNRMRLPLTQAEMPDIPELVEDVDYTFMVKVSLKKRELEGDRITYVLAQTGDYQIVP